MDFAKKIISERSASLQLMKAFTEDNRPFFAYILVRTTDAEKLKEVGKDELMRLPQNSVVIYSDFGEEIPAEVEEVAIEKFKQMLKTQSTG